MFSNDPLLGYHSLLSATRSSGYPNIQLFEPHSYDMSLAAMIPGQQNFNSAIGRHNRQGMRPLAYRPAESMRIGYPPASRGMGIGIRTYQQPMQQRRSAPFRDTASFIP